VLYVLVHDGISLNIPEGGANPEPWGDSKHLLQGVYEKYAENKENPNLANPLNMAESRTKQENTLLSGKQKALHDITRKIANLQTALAEALQTRTTLTQEVNTLQATEFEAHEVVITNPRVMAHKVYDNRLVFETDYLSNVVQDGYYSGEMFFSGKFIVEVTMDSALSPKDAIRITNVSRNERGYGSTHLLPHPHTVYNKVTWHGRRIDNAWTTYVSPCLGTYEGVIIDLIEDRHWEALVDHIILFLCNVNTDDTAGEQGIKPFLSYENHYQGGWDRYELGPDDVVHKLGQTDDQPDEESSSDAS